MLEITPVRAGVVTVLGLDACLEGLAAIPEACVCRIAPGERLLLCASEERARVQDQAAGLIRQADPGGMTVNQSDGWSAWILGGSERDEVLARLSVLPLPRERPAFVMGAVAQVPARIVVGTVRTCLMVPSPVAHHVEKRMLDACSDLTSEVTDAASLDVSLLGGVEAVAAGGRTGVDS